MSILKSNSYRLYDERTQVPLPSEPNQLQALIADGESINVVARA
jgi:hypothetical protein